MSDIRFNRWLHQSGTGGIYQDSTGNIGIGTSVPTSALDVVGIITATSFSGDLTGNITGNVTGNVNSSGVSTITTLNATTISGVSTIGVTTATVTTLTVNGNNYPSAGPLSNRNLIINGAMQVAQRVAAPSTQPSVQYTGYYTVDRFRIVMSSAGTYTISQSTDAPVGFSNSLHLDNTASAAPGAASLLIVDYAIEGSDVQRLDYGSSGAKSLTLSFYVKSDVSGTYTVELFTNNGDNFIGKTYSISGGEVGTWVRRELTFTGNTATSIANDNTRGLTVGFWLAAGSNYTSGTFNNGSWDTTVANRVNSNQVNLSSSTNNDWYITGVQLEVGTVATPFEHRSYGDELARCQRYYQTTGASGAPTNAFGGYVGATYPNNASSYGTARFHVPMRATPAVVLYDSAGTSGTATQNGTANGISASASHITLYGFTIVQKSSGVWTDDARYTIYAGYTASAEL